MTPEERAELAEQIELLQQYTRWIVLKLVTGKSPHRWVIRDPNRLQKLVEELAQYEPYGVKGYRERLDDEFEWPVDRQPAEDDIFGQVFGCIRVMTAAMRAEVVEVTIPSKGITLWIQQAFDQPGLVHKTIAEHEEQKRKAYEEAGLTLGQRLRRQKRPDRDILERYQHPTQGETS